MCAPLRKISNHQSQNNRYFDEKDEKDQRGQERQEPWRAEQGRRDGLKDDQRGHQDGRPLPGGSAEGEGQSDSTS